MTYATSGFVDHYLLDALRRAVDPKLNPAPNEMSPAVTKYRMDLEQYWNKHCLGFSISLRDYLAMSAFGEAQYCPKYGNWRIVGLPAHTDHDKAYAWCVDYSMSEWKKLAQVFNHDWHGVSNIGGKRWFDIANHAAEWQAHFDGKQLAKWIDHAADLEHNSKGGLFNKSVPSSVLNRDLSKADINSFLDWKLYNKNIPLTITSSHWSKYVRQPVRILLERYFTLWGITQKPQWKYPVEYYLQTAPVASPVKWGNKVLKLAKTKHGEYASETSVKTETKKYVEKAVSNGTVLNPHQYGGIPAHLLHTVGMLWMYAIANDGKEVETDGS